MTNRRKKREWERGVRQLMKEARTGSTVGSITEMCVVRAKDAILYLAAPERPFAQMLMLVGQMIEDSAKSGAPVICLLCDFEFAKDGLGDFVLILPHAATGSTALVCPLCSKCANQTDDAIWAAATIPLKKMWPDLRMIGELDAPARVQ
jgi:hypothetical protein